MNEITSYAQAIIQFLSNMDVKASPNNINQITSIHAAVGKITELAKDSKVTPHEIPVEDDKK